jgi:hypothetical protein
VDDWWPGLASGLAVGAFSVAADTRVSCQGRGYEGDEEGVAGARFWWRLAVAWGAAPGQEEERWRRWGQAVAAQAGSNRATNSIWGSLEIFWT